MDSIKIALPFPPSSNTAYPTVVKGRKPIRVKSKRLKDWIASCPEIDINITPPVHITYAFYFPDDRARDGQNFIKPVTDYIISQGVLEDDNRTFIHGEQWIDMGNDKENPRVEIIFKEVGTIWKTMKQALVFMAVKWQPSTPEK